MREKEAGRERDRQREKEEETNRGIKRERECVCVCEREREERELTTGVRILFHLVRSNVPSRQKFLQWIFSDSKEGNEKKKKNLQLKTNFDDECKICVGVIICSAIVVRRYHLTRLIKLHQM